jgi:hypothetical protein
MKGGPTQRGVTKKPVPVLHVKDGIANPNPVSIGSKNQEPKLADKDDTRVKTESTVNGRSCLSFRCCKPTTQKFSTRTRTESIPSQNKSNETDDTDRFTCWPVVENTLWFGSILTLVSGSLITYCASLAIRGKFELLSALSTPFAVVIAVMGYLFNYYVQKMASERALRQERMVVRTHELYGPCAMLCRLNQTVFDEITREGNLELAANPFAIDCLFHPINLKLQAKIMKHSQFVYTDLKKHETEWLEAFLAHVELQKGKVELIRRQKAMTATAISSLGIGSQHASGSSADANVKYMMELITAWNTKNKIKQITIDELKDFRTDQKQLFKEMKKIFERYYTHYSQICADLSNEKAPNLPTPPEDALQDHVTADDLELLEIRIV